MKSGKKVMLGLMISSVLVLSLTVFSSAEKVTIVYGCPTGSTDWKTMRAFVPIFEAINPDIKVEDAGYSRQGYEERLITQFAAGTTEVDFFTEWYSVEEFMDRGFLVPLDGSYDPEIRIDDELRLDILPAMLKLSTYPQFVTPGREQHLYMMPVNNSDAMVYIYRQDLLEEAGLPGPPESWEDRIEWGKKLTQDLDGDGMIDVWGDAYSASQKGMAGREPVRAFLNSLWTAGGQYLDDEGMPAFDSEIGIKTLQYLSDLRNKYKTVPPGVTTYTFAEIRDLIAAGKVAMSEHWFGYWKWLDSDQASQVRGKVMIAPIPYLKKPASYTHGGGLGIPMASEHKKEAWRFLEFMMLKETQTLMHLSLLDTTSRASIAYSPAVEKLFGQRDREALAVYTIITTNAQAMPLFRGSSKVVRALGRRIEQVLLQEMTPEKALKEAAEEIRKIILREQSR